MRFYGQQVNLTTSAIARMNVYLHDIEDAESKDRINAGTPLT
ncbi:MAG: N-6 DNA methylase [Candidatus Limnocylindria bacterium]